MSRRPCPQLEARSFSQPMPYGKIRCLPRRTALMLRVVDVRPRRLAKRQDRLGAATLKPYADDGGVRKVIFKARRATAAAHVLGRQQPHRRHSRTVLLRQPDSRLM